MTRLTRRSFLGQAAGALTISLVLPSMSRAQELRRLTPAEIKEVAATPNAFLRINADSSVMVICKHIEFGQGTSSGLAALAAEELDADWAQVRVESAPANAQLYANLNMGQQGTGGSSGIANSFYQMRKAGAAARAMLVAAAAEAWGVPAAEITVEKGVIRHPASERSAGFGQFAEAASAQPFPEQPALKEPSQFTLIGTDLQRLDAVAKSSGQTTYSIDVTREGLVHSAILHPPVFGARLTSLDDQAALKIADVLAIHEVPQGIAVIARTRHAALAGVAGLRAEWDHAGAETRSTDEMYRDYARAAQEPGADVETVGRGAQGLDAAVQVIEAEYRFPFLAHAPMEPMGAVADVTPERAEIFMASQLVTRDLTEITKVLGLPPEAITLNIMSAGGSFGRLGTPDAEFAAEVAGIAQAWGKGPVKHLWTRENDLRAGRYRPMSLHRLRGGLDADGNIVGWDQVIAIQSFLDGTAFGGGVRNGIDRSATEGGTGLPYAIANRHVGLHLMRNGVPANFWRSVGSSHNVYVVETFLDLLLAQSKKDPVQARLDLLAEDQSRLRAVLLKVAEMADWQGGVQRGDRALGVAMATCFRSHVAEIAEVSRGPDGLPRVHKVWAAIDCGLAINPDQIRSQIEGGIGFALGAALHDEVTLAEGGVVEQSNFDTYPSLRIHEMPEVEVAIIPSTVDPTGTGEPGVPPLAPAVANAWRALTGTPIQTLPFRRGVRA
ncbi:xanthine dehydrogenase family protein molybdopterin-binding subunit [Frigidibacter sp. MR17.24]|uniref:xanthine dehydrogenase family protein molybdopterin-binding subunit n=1 Tax=Frigidibacter sp. MR17.24 TaxID=3127345 RepID=UPI0030130EFA